VRENRALPVLFFALLLIDGQRGREQLSIHRRFAVARFMLDLPRPVLLSSPSPRGPAFPPPGIGVPDPRFFLSTAFNT